MSDPLPLWLIPVLPLAGAVVTALLGPRLLRHFSHWPCILGSIGAFVVSLLVLVVVYQGGTTGQPQAPEIRNYYPWFEIGNVKVAFALQVDTLTALMLVTVTGIGSLIAIYSVGYMHGDPGYARFFAEIALFIFSMTGLVLAANFILLYAFWEGVGLCSYLLIGFWFAKPSAAAAARKAFLVTRLGDIGFFLGILLLWSHFTDNRGEHLYALDFRNVFANASWQSEGLMTAVCLLLFCGAVGKSAQFPLHVWLPDAMEGPTPVSALIHAATMVTAGVYMVARCTPLFERAPIAQLVVGCIGAVTALLAALIALTQNDLKRVLAYSTISQLGYMFLALGCATWLTDGKPDGLVLPAVVAAIFHLFTHAFFKALLFLAAGSVMHAMGGVIDMRRFGGLRAALPTTHWTFLCGALALAGFPLFAGFWSKDAILTVAFAASREGHPYPAVYFLLFISGVVTAGLTAFYTFRAYFLTFLGEYRVPEPGLHVHESPPVMTVPLMLLAVGAVFAGFLNAELLPNSWHWVGNFLERMSSLPHVPGEAEAHEVSGGILVMLAGTVFALGGIGVAAWMYVLRPGLAGWLSNAAQRLYQLSLNKFYLDEVDYLIVVRPLLGFAELFRVFDHLVVDGLVDLVGQVPRLLGVLFRPIQNGLAQFYALAMALGVTVFLLAMVYYRYAY
jgi:NADH-quinone oxidoreductase subunit L